MTLSASRSLQASAGIASDKENQSAAARVLTRAADAENGDDKPVDFQSLWGRRSAAPQAIFVSY